MADPALPDPSPPSVDPPEYKIMSRKDGSLRWYPPAGSAELALALSYHFPRQDTLEDKMQAAILRYIRASKKTASQHSLNTTLLGGQTKFKISASCQTDILSINNSLGQNSTPPLGAIANSQQSRVTQLVWNVNTGEKILGKPKKRQYTKEEQAEVTENRGKVCDYHRRTKKKVCAGH
jgi:hypothetical protein